jgi:hypothetical protein
MHTVLDLITRTTQLVAELDQIAETAAALAASDADDYAEAAILRETAEDVRERLLDGLDQLNPLPILR